MKSRYQLQKAALVVCIVSFAIAFAAEATAGGPLRGNMEASALFSSPFLFLAAVMPRNPRRGSVILLAYILISVAGVVLAFVNADESSTAALWILNAFVLQWATNLGLSVAILVRSALLTAKRIKGRHQSSPLRKPSPTRHQ